MKGYIVSLLFCFFSFFNFGNASAEVLRVGIVAEKPPFAYVASPSLVDQFDGLDIAIIKAIAEDLGRELKLESMTFDALIIGLKTKKIDVAISGITITPERSRAASFTEPYFTSNLSMVVPVNSTIQKAADMKGKRLSTVLGTVGDVALKKLGFPYETLKAYPEGIIDVKNGKCDAFVMDETIARRFCSNMKEIKILRDVETFGVGYFGIAVKKNNTQLLEKLNASLKKIKDSGQMEIFLKKYTQ